MIEAYMNNTCIEILESAPKGTVVLTVNVIIMQPISMEEV